jgi:hypothetical protein
MPIGENRVCFDPQGIKNGDEGCGQGKTGSTSSIVKIIPDDLIGKPLCTAGTYDRIRFDNFCQIFIGNSRKGLTELREKEIAPVSFQVYLKTVQKTTK